MNQPIANLDAFKARQKATWEAGDFGEVAKHIESAAEEFMGSLALRPGLRLLDAACGTGNLAIHAARAPAVQPRELDTRGFHRKKCSRSSAATCRRRRLAFRPRCSGVTNPRCASVCMRLPKSSVRDASRA